MALRVCERDGYSSCHVSCPLTGDHYSGTVRAEKPDKLLLYLTVLAWMDQCGFKTKFKFINIVFIRP